MQDVLVLSLGLWAAAATILAGWAWRGWSMATERAQLTDWQKVADDLGLHQFSVRKRLTEGDLDDYDVTRKEVARLLLDDLKGQLVGALAESNAMVVRRQEHGPQPYVEYELRIVAATDYFEAPDLEPVDEIDGHAPAKSNVDGTSAPPAA